MIIRQKSEGVWDLTTLDDELILINQEQYEAVQKAENDYFLTIQGISFFKRSIKSIKPHYETQLRPEKTYHWYSGDTYYFELCNKVIYGGAQKAIEHKC